MTTRQIVRFFVKYKYQAIFPIAVVEGPIITIISGFLVSLGQLSLLPALLVVFLGDVISDCVFYCIGRGGRRALQYVKFLHISESRLEKIENRYRLHPWKTMLIAKVSYGLGNMFMIASGASRMKWQDFIKYIASLDIVRSSILLSFGYYFGKTALHLGPTYLWYYALIIIIFVPTSYLIFRKKYQI